MMSILLMLVGNLFGFLVLFPFMARALARHNAFFTFIEEGTFKVFLHNKAFKRGVLRYHGFFVDERWNIKQDRRRKQSTPQEVSNWGGEERRGKKEEQWWQRLWGRYYWNKLMGGGLVGVGLWPFDAVHEYEFRWVAPKEGKDELHRKILDYAFAKTGIYTVEIKGAEAKGMVPLDMKLRLTIRLVNLYKPLFRCHQWLEFVTSRLGSYVREFVPATGLEFEELIKVKQLPGGPLFEFLRGKGALTDEEKQFYREDGYSESAINSLEKAGGGILAILKEAFGIAVEGIEFVSINSVDRVYETAAAKEWSARQEEKAIKVLASAEAKKIDIIAKAEARKVRKISKAIKDYGDIGLASKGMETLKEASPKWGWIIPSDLLGFFKKIGGQEGGGKQ